MMELDDQLHADGTVSTAVADDVTTSDDDDQAVAVTDDEDEMEAK